MVRNLVCIFMVTVWTMILFVPASLATLIGHRQTMWVVQRWWAPVLLAVAGAKLKVEGLEHIDPTRPIIFVSNHQSTLDIPTLFFGLPVPFTFVTKHSVKHIPFLGWFINLAGFIFVDRGNHVRAVASLKKAAEKIQRGTNLVMFAEGTRSPDGHILPFKKGPFELAMQAQVRLHPVAIEGTRSIQPKNSWQITPGPVRVIVGPVVEPAQFKDRDALMRAVRDAVISQNLALGGLGGNRDDVVAARGLEGIGKTHEGTA